MIARQPVYNNQMGVFGYELFFRAPGDTTGVMKPTGATAQVLASSILEYGLDKFVNNRKAVINVTRAFLDVMPEVQLPANQIILDIPDNIAIDAKLPARLAYLRSMGFGLSIGGLESFKDRRLLQIASIFRIDVSRVNSAQLTTLIKDLRHFDNISILALKVETLDDYRNYCDRGVDYLQGYFLSKPRIFPTRDLPTNKLSLLRLLASVHNVDTPIIELEEQISNDVSLSYKLLKLINSPFFGVARKIDSIKQAIVLLGRDEIRKWVSLLALAGMDGEHTAVMEIAVLRAKLCELLAEKAGLQKESYFTVGMFSTLDLLMQQPIKSILTRLPLSEEVKAAIFERQGMLGHALACALAIENAQWSKVHFADLHHEDLAAVQRDALLWTNNILSQQ